MTDQRGATKDGVCRRSLLKSVPTIAGAIISATAIPNSVFAQTKVSAAQCLTRPGMVTWQMHKWHPGVPIVWGFQRVPGDEHSARLLIAVEA